MSEKDLQVWAEAVCGLDVSIEESQKAYRNWASTYDQYSEKYRLYNNYVKVASILQDLVEENQRGNIRILDVGAGTGLVAKELKKYNFQHIDALEPSEAMLDMARRQNLYENYFVEFLTASPSSIPENSYDVLTGSGMYGKAAHVPCDALYEMIRLVKPGGFIVLVGNFDLIRAGSDNDDLEPLMGRLVTAGKLKKVLRETWMCQQADNETIERIAWCYKVL